MMHKKMLHFDQSVNQDKFVLIRGHFVDIVYKVMK